MVTLDDALRRLRTLFPSAGDADPPDEAAELAADARGDGVTPAVLANESGRSNRPLYEYTAPDEQPAYVIRGNQVIVDDGEDYETKYPTRDTQILVSDRRVLVVLGGQLRDDCWEMALDDVQNVYVDDEGVKEYVVLEARREGEPMTFFVDVTVEDETSDVRDAVEFIEANGA